MLLPSRQRLGTSVAVNVSAIHGVYPGRNGMKQCDGRYSWTLVAKPFSISLQLNAKHLMSKLPHKQI